MKKILTLFILLSISVTNWDIYAESVLKKDRYGFLNTMDIHPELYPYLVVPKEYPEYYRRPYPALSWEDFDNKTQFVVGRNVPLDSTELSDAKGNIYRPNLSFMRDKDFIRRLQFAAKNNLWLHNIGGYGPGSAFPLGNGFGEYIVPKWQIKQIERYIRNRFTGFDVGEQDGRFNFTYRSIIEPYVPDKIRQYLVSQPYFDRIAADQGYWCSALSVLWYWNYILKEGYTILVGAETQNKITNGQVQYMHLRGAGKQYGILWYGDVSVFDSWGCKNYDKSNDYEDANKGGSLSLMKRSYYTQYMYNSTILSMEQGWCEGSWGQNKGELSPIGIMHNDCVEFVEKYGQPGTMITQVALLNDFYSGWMPASHITGTFRVWNGMPYAAGDYLTDALVSMFYPNYERSGFFFDETGAMCATPYGENVDALWSDARVEVMKQYPIMVAAGDLFSGGKELADKVNDYVQQGGTFVVTAQNAIRLWPEWNIEMKKNIPGGVKIQIGQNVYIEEGKFKLYEADIPVKSYVIARMGNMPIALWIPMGKGGIMLSLTGYGLNEEPYPVENSLGWNSKGFNTYLERPYCLLNHFKAILDYLFSSVELFSVGDNLGYIVNYLDKGRYRIAVYNNTFKSLPFKIESKIGEIISIKELSTGNKLFHSMGYYPNNMKGEVNGKDDGQHIYGGDIRLFDVEIKDDRVKIKDKIPQVSPVVNSYLTFSNMMFLKEQIRQMPTFFDYFDGVAIEGSAILGMDDVALQYQNEWYRLQSLDIAADLRHGFYSGTWTFDVLSPNFQKTKDDLKKIARKLEMLYGKHFLFIPSIYQEQCPDELIRSCNISFVENNLGTSNWTYGKNCKLLDCPDMEWEHIYRAMLGYSPVKDKKIDKLDDQCVSQANRNHILALDRYEDNIRKAISEIDCFYDAFGGVCISAEYIASKSLETLQKEKEWWDKIGLSVVVSFIEEINHFPGLTLCDAVPVYYKRSMTYYRNVLNKMGDLNLKYALFTTQPSVEAHYSEQRVYDKMKETFAILTNYAKKKDVRILLTNTRFRIAGSVAQQKHLIEEINEKEYMGLAINLNHLSKEEYIHSIDLADNFLKAIILGGIGSMEHSEYLPISESGKSSDRLNKLEKTLLIEKVWPVNNKSIYKDCKYMNWIKE